MIRSTLLHEKTKYPTNGKIYNHTNEILSFDLADMVAYKTSNIEGFRYICVFADVSSKFKWDVPLKNDNSQTITG